MNVSLTETHYRTLLRVTAGTPLQQVFTREVITTSKTGLSVVAPYIAWEHAQSMLTSMYWTHRPKPAAQPPHHVRVMMRRIATAQNAHLRHPAMKGLAMLGVHIGWFPVWIDSEGRRSPMPNGGRFAVIGSRVVEGQRKSPFTVWVEDGAFPADNWLAQEQTHTALL